MNPESAQQIASAVAAAVVQSLCNYVTPLIPGPLVNEANHLQAERTEEEEQLRMFISLRLPIAEMARTLQVSRPTVYSLLKKYNLHQTHKYSNISDNNLDRLVCEIKRNHPSAGQITMEGHLVARGINIQRQRLRASLVRVDMQGIEMRRLHTIRRRVYSVPGPNFLWHIDGTHKLIRWSMVVHAGIDGYSRLLVFVQCSNNNRAQTVETLFERARQKYGNPLRVRTDEGGENVRVWDAMNTLYDVASNPVIVGSSVHNQRIERAHRDLNEQVINRYYNLFYQLERSGQLNPENATDLFCLHYVYIPHVNRSLCEFVLAHNNHKISTARNCTPLQLFLLGYHVRQGHAQADPDFHGGIAVSALNRTNLPHVHVNPIMNPLTEEQHHQLRLSIDPLTFRDTVAAFRQTVTFVANCLTNN